MVFLLFSVISYLVCTGIHAMLHRLLARWRKMTFASVWIFLLGLIFQVVNVWYFLHPSDPWNSIWNLPLQWTSIVMYGLLVWLHIILYTGPYFGDQGPSIRIRKRLTASGPMTLEEIRNLFSDHVLIEKRIHDLIAGEFIEKRNGRFTATSKGFRLHNLLEQYRKLIRWDSSG